MTQSPDDGLREMVALAAVGALDADERAALDAHLATRADLREEMAEMELAVAALAEATAVAPPSSLRATVLDAVRDVRQEPAPLATPTASGEQRGVAPVSSMVGRRRRRRHAVLAAGAALAAAMIGVVVVQTGRGDDALDMADVVDASDAVSTELTGELQGLRVVRSPAAGAIALVGDGVVPPPGDDQVYELWLIEDAPARVDIFRPDDDGRVGVVVAGMEPAADAIFAVTVEPAGGSSSPTGDIVAATP